MKHISDSQLQQGMRRGSYAPSKLKKQNDDLMIALNPMKIQPQEAEDRLTHHKNKKLYKRSFTFNLDRNIMSAEQRQFYDTTTLQVKLVESFPDYVRQAEDFTFIRMIGKGGYGHVWVANDLKTGNIVAIKEIHHIDGRNQNPLLRFIREVQTMIQVKSRFVLPIYGFTAELPFSIIMPFTTGNTLNDILQKKQYTFTDLTLYAICVARGMKDIHDAGIIYRDLKASNILMDHDGIPMICDFGTAKVFTENKRMTLKAGTFCFMAPEVYINPHYDKKCDIYSYGSLLYELSELSIPFKKMNMKEQLNFMLSGKIPEFRKDRTPRALKKLIIRCWDLDPKKRPEWDEIIELFESGQVFFRYTNLIKVRIFVSKMREEIKNFRPFSPPPSSNYQKLIDDLHEHLYKNHLFFLGQEKVNQDLIVFQKPTVSTQADLGSDFKLASAPLLEISSEEVTVNEKEEEEDNNDNDLDEKRKELNPEAILSSPDSPEFPIYLDFLAKELAPRHFMNFYGNTLSYIRGFWDCPQTPLVFHCYESISRRNPEFLDLCVEADFFKMISKKTLHYSMGMVSLLVHYRPQYIEDSELNLVINLLQNDPYEAIYIFGEAANNFQKLPKLVALFDALLTKSDLFLEHQTGNIYLGIFYTLYTKSDIYKKIRKNAIIELFINFLDNELSIHKVTAINAICNIYDSSFILSFDSIMKLLNHSHINCRNSCISLLMRMENYPVSQKFCNSIIDEIPENEKAFYILLKFASEGFEQSKIILKYPKWMSEYIAQNGDNSKQLIWFSLQLFMVICLHEKIRKKIVKLKEFPEFIKKLFSLNSRTVFVALNAALKKMKLKQKFIDEIVKDGVVDLFVDQTHNPKMAAICIMTLKTLVAHGYSVRYEIFIPMASSVLSDDKYDIITKKATLQFLCVLAPMKNITEKIKKCDELMNFVIEDQTPELAKYIQIFNQTIGIKIEQ